MQFASLEFALFFVLVLQLSWLTKGTIRKWVLLIASYIFYGQLGAAPLCLLLFSTSFNHMIGNALVGLDKTHASRWLSAGIGINLGMLGLYKYANFFRGTAEDLAALLGMEAHLSLLELMLPVGISFYTFQAIAYLVDIYRGHGIRAKSLLDFALFQAYFPQIMIGPICRSRDLLPQFASLPTKIPNPMEGLLLICSGLFKKLFLASLLFEYGATTGFEDPIQHSSAALWGSMFGYTMQLYCDFSGYTDMARGFSLLLGIELPRNFDKPYAATNLGAFWQRWHISFSQWLRDYIYLPLGGSFCSPWKISFNLFMTFLFCGLWHGASMGFVVWGGIHGIGLALHKRARDKKRARGEDPTVPKTTFHAFGGWVYTFLFVAGSRVVFQAPEISTSLTFYKKLFVWSTEGVSLHPVLVGAIVLSGMLHVWTPYNVLRNWFEQLAHQKKAHFSYLCFLVLFVIILLLRPGGVAPYLYFRF